MKPPTLALEQDLNSLKLRRELLDAKTELETVHRKLLRTESALDSLAGFLTVIPDPIEIVSEDFSVLFANEASKKLHDNDQLEGTLYHQSILGVERLPDKHPIHPALRENRDVVFSSVFNGGDVYETAATPTILSDGRRAVLCVSKPVVLSGADPLEKRRGESGGVVVSAESGEDEMKLLRRITTMTTRTLDAVLDQISDGVVVANEAGDVILANRAFYDLTGRNEDDLLSLSEILSAFEPALDSADTVRASTEIRRFRTAIANSDAGQVPVEVSVAGIPEDAENPAGILMTIRDLLENHPMMNQTEPDSRRR